MVLETTRGADPDAVLETSSTSERGHLEGPLPASRGMQQRSRELTGDDDARPPARPRHVLALDAGIEVTKQGSSPRRCFEGEPGVLASRAS
jgi:hypothetical protein